VKSPLFILEKWLIEEFSGKAFGFWLLAIGFWLLAFSYWLLANSQQPTANSQQPAPAAFPLNPFMSQKN